MCLFSDEKFLTVQQPGCIVTCAMFSPVEPMHLMFAGQDGVYAVDIRNPKRLIYYFPNDLRLN